MPTKEQIEQYQKDQESDDDEIKEVPNGTSKGNSDDDDIQIIHDDHKSSVNGSKSVDPLSISPEEDEELDWPPYPTVRYEVIEIEPWDYKDCKVSYY